MARRKRPAVPKVWEVCQCLSVVDEAGEVHCRCVEAPGPDGSLCPDCSAGKHLDQDAVRVPR